MAVIQELRRRSKQVVFPVIGACVLGYFTYHTVQGDRGLLAYGRLNQEVTRAKATLDSLQRERESLERRTDLLRNESLDLDMLEERARQSFDLVHQNDLVIFLPAKSN
ncbi:septum formation initiator family protein [Hwanghaeella grinnelliae]|uniref:Septum formation initiator family protein n=1 Tax=Hwanghaeella grinnelliae TaxID=2500179 RepID=A0A3S2WVD0_9PROT|nr:septum formation initiator family protein [Hwanghaeella grinnelliae]RVU39350.1 septum formation initiator family protein [Hwanghaeella grinnelliae]